MKTLTSFNQTASDSPHTDLIRLAKIELSGLTLYFCDRSFGSAGSEMEFNSQLYEPMVLSWSEIRSGKVGLEGKPSEPGETSFVIDNTIPVGGVDYFTKLFNYYKPAYSVVTISEIFEGASASDEIIRFKGSIEDIDMGWEEVTLHCSDLSIDIDKKIEFEVMDEETYPEADPDDWGKMLPIVYGQAKRVPFLAADAGSMSTLVTNITNVQSTFDVSEGSKFPSGGAEIQIDFERILYVQRVGNTLTGCIRGYNGTDAVAHNVGATVAEIQTAYIYLIGHPVHSIDDVYVINRNSDENVLQSGNYTVYTGQSGDEHTDYPGKAVIQFNTIPSIEAQVNVEIEDTIDVDDNIAVQDAQHKHNAGGVDYEVYEFEQARYTVGDGGWFSCSDIYHQENCTLKNIVDNNVTSWCAMQGQGTNVELSKVFVQDAPGDIEQYRVCCAIYAADTNCGVHVDFINSTIDWSRTGGDFVVNVIEKGPWREYSGTWENFLNEEANITRTGTSAGGYVLASLVWVELIIGAEVPQSYSGVTKQNTVLKIGTVELVGNSVADTVIGGRVSADIQGYEADDSGDYGTDGEVIERPDYILKHFLIERCGLTSSEIGTTYTQAGSDYDSNNITLAPVLLEKPNIREFISQIAFQSRSIEYWEEGKHNLKWIPYTDTSDKTIEAARIDIESILLSYTPRAEILNKFVGAYNKEWIGAFGSSAYSEEIESQRNVVLAQSVTSQADFGVLEEDPLQLDFIRDESLAQRILNYFRDVRCQPRLVVEYTGGQYLTDFEKGDIFDFVFEADADLDKRLLGLVTSEGTQFRIIDMEHREGGVIWIQGILVVSSSTSSGAFYPSSASDDGYTQGSTFYNDTIAIPIGDYQGSPVY